MIPSSLSLLIVGAVSIYHATKTMITLCCLLIKTSTLSPQLPTELLNQNIHFSNPQRQKSKHHQRLEKGQEELRILNLYHMSKRHRTYPSRRFMFPRRHQNSACVPFSAYQPLTHTLPRRHLFSTNCGGNSDLQGNLDKETKSLFLDGTTHAKRTRLQETFLDSII